MKLYTRLRRKTFPLILIYSIASILCGLTVPIAAVKPPSQVVFRVEPTVTDGVPVDGNFTVDVYIDAPAGSAIIGWKINIKVDPDVLEPGAWIFEDPFYRLIKARGGQEGYFLYDWCYGPPEKWANGTKFNEGAADPTTGAINETVEALVAWADPDLLPRGEGADGSGKLVTFYFTSKNETAYSLIEITEAYYYTSLSSPELDKRIPDVIIDGHYINPAYDVAVTSVSAPTNATVGELVDINVTVANLGDSAALNLTLTYNSTIIETRLMSLASAESKNESFSWNTTEARFARAGNYTIKAEAIRQGDPNLANNFKTTTITIFTRDVAITNITAPTNATVGELVPINVTVENQGSYDENVNVTIFRDSTIINTTDIGVLPIGGNETVEFSWDTTDLSTGTYTINATATITLDEDPSDNNATKQITLKATRDVAITNISAPTPAVLGDFIPINVTVENQGNYTESVTVKVYNGTTEIGTDSFPLARGLFKTSEFSWSTTDLSTGTYTINATATITLDEDPSDNNATKQITLKFGYDVAITNISAPTNATVGELANITVVVKNDGVYNVTDFVMNVTYDAGVIETRSVSLLASGNETSLLFSWNTTDVDPASYTITAEAILAGDEDLTNNQKTKPIRILLHDVAITNVTASTDTATIGETVSINVTVMNEGTETETFNVTVYYSDTIIETRSITELASGDSQTLPFSWDTSNVTAGTYTIKAVATTVTGETDTVDNTNTDVTVTIATTAALDIILYVVAAVVVIIIIAAVAIYFLKIRKPT